MASRDDSPTSLHGQPWSVWADRLGRDSPLSDTEENHRQPAPADSMKLPAQDMCYYGLCPVQDEFYLVICNICGQVYTPQGLKNHIELRHARKTEPQPPEPPDSGCSVPQSSKNTKSKRSTSTASSSGASSQPTSLAALLSGPAPKAATKAARRDRSATASTGKSGSFSHERANAKVPAAVAAALTGIPFDKIPSPQQPPPTEQPNLTSANVGPTLAAQSPVSPLSGAGITLPQAAAITMTVAVDSSGMQTVQIHLPEIAEAADADLPDPAPRVAVKRRKPSKSERRLLPLKEREFDPEKHCGVWMNDCNKPCTRSLTCKAHSLTLRRGVAGRSRPFDDLLADHRASKEVLTKQNKETSLQQPIKITLPASSTSATVAAASPTITSILKSSSMAPKSVAARPKSLPLKISPTLNPAPTLAALLQSTPSAGELCLEIPSSGSPVPNTTPLLQRVISVAAVTSQTEKTAFNCSSHHPRPLAVCTFGLRRQNHSWDGLKAALNNALNRTAMSKINRPQSTTMQSVLRPPLLDSSGANGFRVGVKRPGTSSVSSIKFRKVAAKSNGLAQPQQQQDLMDGFDGLVGEDGVLTFLSQGEEEAATLNLMADFNAGNITFSEILTPDANSGSATNSQATQGPVTLRLLSSATGLLLQHDPGDQL